MKTKKLFLAALALIVLLFSAGTVLSKSGAWSTYEKRALAKEPEVTLEAVFSGKAEQALEDYLNDRVFSRERLLRLRVRLLAAIGKQTVNEVVLTDSVLLPLPQQKELGVQQRENAEKIAASMARVQQQTEQFGGQFLYVLVPEQRSALRDFYPEDMENDSAYYDACAELLLQQLQKNGVRYLDLRQTLGENALNNYYKTDHHYNLTGAYNTYAAICGVLSISPCEITVEDTDALLTGTYACKLFGTNTVTDRYQIYTPSVLCTREDNGALSDTPLFAGADGQTMYDAYMGGDKGETILRTNRSELPDALLVGNSFTNALEAIAYQSFDELHSLDFRHYYQSTLTEYIARYQPQYVIVLCDDVSCLTTSGNNLPQ